MDESSEQIVIQRKLVRQLRWLNISLTIFGLLGIVGFAVIAFLLFQVLLFAKDTGDRLQNFQQTTTEQLDVKSQVCAGNDSFSEFLRTNTEACR